MSLPSPVWPLSDSANGNVHATTAATGARDLYLKAGQGPSLQQGGQGDGVAYPRGVYYHGAEARGV